MDLANWLKQNGLSAEAYDAESLLNQFLLEMQRGLDGQPSSLAMIPAYLGIEGTLPVDSPVAIIDAGGTNLRVGLVSFSKEGSMVLHHFEKQPMPGRDKICSVDEFYTLLVDALEPFSDRFTSIGFCFSYPAEILPNHDGRLLAWTKEIKIPDLVGKEVGAGLQKKLEERGIKNRSLVLLNDTVATLFAGLAQGQSFNASSYIGFILGTGTNIAYVEQNKKIKKLPHLTQGKQIINVESGGFSCLKTTRFDQDLDAKSEHPGRHIFEKLISGAYLGDLVLQTAKALLSKNIFSTSATTYINEQTSLSTIYIDNLSRNNVVDAGPLGSDLFTDTDHNILKTIFEHIVERAALLTAVNLASAIIKSGAGTDSSHPICVNIDGSTYYKTNQLASKTQTFLTPLLQARKLHIQTIQENDSPATGAAIAALTL